MELSADEQAIHDGEPFWEGSKAYFDVEDLHIAFMEDSGLDLSQWQTSNALTQLGIRSVQRRLKQGQRRRLRVVAIPKAANCNEPEFVYTEEDRAAYFLHMPAFAIGGQVGQPYMDAKKEYESHGLSRRARRFVHAEVAKYPLKRKVHAMALLDSWDADEYIQEYYEALRVEQVKEEGYESMITVWFESEDAFGFDIQCRYFENKMHVYERSVHLLPGLTQRLLGFTPVPEDAPEDLNEPINAHKYVHLDWKHPDEVLEIAN